MKTLNQITDWEQMINEVVLADCFEAMKLIQDNSIDCIITDPPYGTTALEWDKELNFDKFWDEIKRIRKDKSVIIIFGSEPFSSKLRLSNINEYRYDWVWNKVTAANIFNIKNRPFKTHENIMIFSDSANFTFNPQRTMRSEKSLQRSPIGKIGIRKAGDKLTHYGGNSKAQDICLSIDGTKHPIDILEFSKSEVPDGEVRFSGYTHPTRKPLNLIRYLVQTYSKEGDILLDPFMGSWTTARACKDLGRDFIGFELEKEFCEKGEKRLEQEVLF